MGVDARAARVLLVGCGNIAGRFDMHRPAGSLPLTQAGAFQRHPGFELTACVDPDAQARETFAAHWQISRSASSIETLPAQPGDFDVIGICSPTVLHPLHLEAALRLEPRVIFCEKPLTPSLAQSRQWVQTCADRGVQLIVDYTRQWDPAVARIVDEVHSGQWGQVRCVAGHYNKGLLNNGGHLIDLLLQLLGPLQVLAATAPVADHWPDDPTVAALLVSAAGGVPVSLNPAHASDYALFEVELVCERGVIRMCNGGMRWQIRRAGTSPHFTGYRSLAGPQDSDGEYPQAMTMAIADIHAYLTQGRLPRSDGANALAVQSVCENILALARSPASRQS